MILAAPMFAFGLVAFGFLGMGPVTIAVDSFGPVTDNAQSIYELSLIENEPGVREEVKKQFGVEVDFERAKRMLEAARRRGQYLQSQRQAGADRHGRGGRHYADLRHNHGADQLAHHKPGQAFDSARSVSAGPGDGRRDHLLVHRRFNAGGDHGRLPRCGVHQEQHEHWAEPRKPPRRTARRWWPFVRDTRKAGC